MVVLQTSGESLYHRLQEFLSVVNEASVTDHIRVAPSVQCVSLLVFVFFGLYLLIICIRVARAACWWFAGISLGVSLVEWHLAFAAECFGIAPMLSVLMIGSRLRAMELDPSRTTDPDTFVMGCMFLGSGALLLRVFFEVLLAGGNAQCRYRDYAQGFIVSIHGHLCLLGNRGTHNVRGSLSFREKALRCCFHITSVILYLASAYILVFGVLASRPSDGDPLPFEVPPSAMMKSIAFIAAFVLFENIVLEVAELVELVRRSPAGLGGAEFASIGDTEGHALQTLHFPIMFCVLLLGLEMRAVQLGLRAGSWKYGMYAAAFSIAVQICWTLAATFRVSYFRIDEEKAPPPWMRYLWLGLIGLLYLGVVATLIGVFVMEVHPVGSYRPRRLVPPDNPFLIEGEGHELGVAGPAAGFLQTVGRLSGAVPLRPLAETMKCVMLLTSVYFGTSLFLAGCTASVTMRKWANSVSRGLQCALAFAPMLCVMMIAVRLRAMQLWREDPQEWAQAAMYVATASISLQVLCSLWSTEDICEATVLVKVLSIGVLVVNYVAAGLMFLAVGTLLGAVATLA